MPDIGIDAAGGRDDVHHAVVSVTQPVAELSTAVEFVLNVDDALLWPVPDRGKNMQLILWDNLDLVGIRAEIVRPDDRCRGSEPERTLGIRLTNDRVEAESP